MLKLLNPYSILAVLAVAALLFGGGYLKGRTDGKNAALRTALNASQAQTKLANQGAKTLTRVANENDDSVTDSSIGEWMFGKQPWK